MFNNREVALQVMSPEVPVTVPVLPPPPPVPAPFTVRLAIGLTGLLLASLIAGLNDRITSIGLPDVRGALGVGYDQGTWIDTAYAVGEALGMLIAPWCAITFSMRRFAAFAIILLAVLGILTPWAPNMGVFLALRLFQGMSGGFLIPLLMAAALRFLPPNIKLYGLAAYALTVTLGPNLATAAAAFWTDFVGWQFVFWQAVPLCGVAAYLILYGIPQDPIRPERLKLLDWRGLLLGWSGFSCFVIAFEQGERLDWFNSPLICTLFLFMGILLPLFVFNEWHHPLPFMRFQLLGRRNFCYGVLTLVGFVIISLSTSYLPSVYLSEIRDYRPLQIGPATLFVALPSLILLPAVCVLLNLRRMDPRWMAFGGLLIIGGCCYRASFITSDWIGTNFYVLQVTQAVGQAMLAVSLLMLSTSVLSPADGPFAASIINTMRSLAAPLGQGLLEAFVRVRENFHSNVLLDHIGQVRFTLVQANSPLSKHMMPLMADGTQRWPDSLQDFAGTVHEQAVVMSISDAFLALLGLAVILLALVILLPTRAYPPRIAATMQSR
jgi:MFS transporter, DHA2 family, multidrug resistance protein